jgi:hypothetical protein
MAREGVIISTITYQPITINGERRASCRRTGEGGGEGKKKTQQKREAFMSIHFLACKAR